MSTSDTPMPDDTPKLGRRHFLIGSAAIAGGTLLTPDTAAAGGHRWRRGKGPNLSHGLQVGDVTEHAATLWARAESPGRMYAEVFMSKHQKYGNLIRGPWVDEATDNTGRIQLNWLPDGADIRYKIWFEGKRRGRGEAEMGSFRTGGYHDRSTRFVWTGDCAGQGWGINPDVGGMFGWESMRQESPDFFVFSGDTVYADGPLSEEVVLRDGSTWRNLVTPEKAKVAETLTEFRGQFQYNLLDDNVKRFNAEVPVIAQWDDHEVVNNWYPGEILTDDRYTEKSVDVLAARASQAFQEYFPMQRRRPGPVHRKISYGGLIDVFVLDLRTFRGPNSPGLDASGPNTTGLGDQQVRWLIRNLRRSYAQWKIIASDMPVGLVVPDGPMDIEAIANRDPGEPLGRELEIARILAAIKRHHVDNVVWLTADTHYAAAHHYDPGRAAFTKFNPFWEFVAGPINAGTFGPNDLDATFGPSAEFVEAALYPNMPPTEGRQYYGVVDASHRDLTVTLKNISGATLSTTTIPAA